MLAKHKLPSFGAGLMIIVVFISIFSFVFLTENNKIEKAGMAAENKITGEMVKVTGMEFAGLVK